MVAGVVLAAFLRAQFLRAQQAANLASPTAMSSYGSTCATELLHGLTLRS